MYSLKWQQQPHLASPSHSQCCLMSMRMCMPHAVSVGPSILLCECCHTVRQGLVQSGFLWGYMATQMIGGSLADKYGGRVSVANQIPSFVSFRLFKASNVSISLGNCIFV